MHCEHLAYAILRRSIRTGPSQFVVGSNVTEIRCAYAGSEVSLDMAWTALLRLSSCAPVSLARHVHAALLKEILGEYMKYPFRLGNACANPAQTV